MKKLWIAGVMIATLNACSLFVVKGPGNWTPTTGRAPVCDDEAKLPVAVDLFAAAMGAGGLGAGITGGGDSDPLDTRGRVVAVSVGGVLLIGGLISAYLGISRARECRAAQADWLAR